MTQSRAILRYTAPQVKAAKEVIINIYSETLDALQTACLSLKCENCGVDEKNNFHLSTIFF